MMERLRLTVDVESVDKMNESHDLSIYLSIYHVVDPLGIDQIKLSNRFFSRIEKNYVK